jgi:hypothetical protein
MLSTKGNPMGIKERAAVRQSNITAHSAADGGQAPGVVLRFSIMGMI